MKLLVLALLCGGAGGLLLGRLPPRTAANRQALLAQARAALTGDLQTADLDRAIAAVNRVLEDVDDWEARALRTQLERQRRCRLGFEAAEHALANHDCGGARDRFMAVANTCRLFDIAQLRVKDIDAELQEPRPVERAGALRPIGRDVAVVRRDFSCSPAKQIGP